MILPSFPGIWSVTYALGGSANSRWTSWQVGPGSISGTRRWTAGTWERKRGEWLTNYHISEYTELKWCTSGPGDVSHYHAVLYGYIHNTSVLPIVKIAEILFPCFTYLSTRFLCFRMVLTSAAVAGPWSFCPFSISFSNSSIDWIVEENAVQT